MLNLSGTFNKLKVYYDLSYDALQTNLKDNIKFIKEDFNSSWEVWE